MNIQYGLLIILKKLLLKILKAILHIEYEYELLQYTKDEYIKLMSEQNYETQLALVELYESLGVQDMSRIYANLIERGLKTLNDVPKKLKKDVEEILKNDGYLKEDVKPVEE